MDPKTLRDKARAILLGNQAQARGNAMVATSHFRQAAELEEQVAHELAGKGRRDFLVNAISAVSCWIKAGEPERALLAASRAFVSVKAGQEVDDDLVLKLHTLLAPVAEELASSKAGDVEPAEGAAPTSLKTEPLDLGSEHASEYAEWRERASKPSEFRKRLETSPA